MTTPRTTTGLPPSTPLAAMLGGTADTRPLAERLLARGWRVAVSTATDQPLDLPAHPALTRRVGALDRAGMAAWLRERGASALLDAAHPYAEAAHATAVQAAADAGVPCFRFLRPAALDEDEKNGDAIWADGHDDAARKAFAFGVPVLVTTGARNLAPYADAARRTGLAWTARVLPREDGVAACRDAGLPVERIVAAVGPFSEADNIALLRAHGCGVLVTKDGGAAGGLAEKIRAARRADARLVVIRRPATTTDASTFQTWDAVVEALEKGVVRVPSSGSGT